MVDDCRAFLICHSCPILAGVMSKICFYSDVSRFSNRDFKKINANIPIKVILMT